MMTGKLVTVDDKDMRKHSYRESLELELSPTKLKRLVSEYPNHPKSVRSHDLKSRKHSLFFAGDEAEILATITPLKRKQSIFPSSEYLYPPISRTKSVSSYQLSALAVAEQLGKVQSAPDENLIKTDTPPKQSKDPSPMLTVHKIQNSSVFYIILPYLPQGKILEL